MRLTNLVLFSERTSSIWLSVIQLSLFHFSWEAPVWSLPHTNKGTSPREEELSLYPSICRLCWEAWPPNITNTKCMLSIKNSSIWWYQFQGDFWWESVHYFFYKIKFVPSQYNSFLWNTVGLKFLICLWLWNSCVEGREVNCFNDIAGGGGPCLYVL